MRRNVGDVSLADLPRQAAEGLIRKYRTLGIPNPATPLCSPDRSAAGTRPARLWTVAARRLATLRDEFVLRSMRVALRQAEHGSLAVRLPSGGGAAFGSPGPAAELEVKRLGAIWRALDRGVLGFAESYIDGGIETPDLAQVFRFYVSNHGPIRHSGQRFARARLRDGLGHRLRRNTRAGSRRNIAAHYDLGNTFYGLWLDEGMTYSSGLYRGPAMSLAAAQEEKYRRILDALDLAPGHALLEIGCGWGGMAEAACRAGARVTAVTISAAQFAYARERLSAEGLASRADVRFEDYRDIEGTFDRLVSIEMIEAVGEEHWPRYFSVLRDRLAPGGTAVLQAITIDESHFADYRRRPDFIQRYIFPGGMLPTVSGMERLAKAAGLAFETVERFGASYARTLAHWRERFHAAWPSIAGLGFDERFRRMWEFYFVYCEVGFERGAIDVGIYRLRKA